MQISIDNGKTYVEADGVRIRYPELANPFDIDGPDLTLQINATHEGLIFDVFEETEDGLYYNGLTNSVMASEILDGLDSTSEEEG